MGQLSIPSEVLPTVIRAEIVGLERDFAHLSEAARARAIRANLSDEAWAYIDGVVAERLRTLGPDVLADAPGASRRGTARGALRADPAGAAPDHRYAALCRPLSSRRVGRRRSGRITARGSGPWSPAALTGDMGRGQMARAYRTGRPPKVSASACCACGQGRGDVQQALVGRMRLGSVWLCTGCAERDTHRQTFLAAYVALMAQGGTGWRGEPARDRAEEG